jgi:hypothetical protein
MRSVRKLLLRNIQFRNIFKSIERLFNLPSDKRTFDEKNIKKFFFFCCGFRAREEKWQINLIHSGDLSRAKIRQEYAPFRMIIMLGLQKANPTQKSKHFPVNPCCALKFVISFLFTFEREN